MQKRMFVYFFIFTMCLFYFAIPNVIFGQSLAKQVFDEYEELLLRNDVRILLPDALVALKNPQSDLNYNIIGFFVRSPNLLKSYIPNIDTRFIDLLKVDDDLKAFIVDDPVRNLILNPKEIDELVKLINQAPTTPTRLEKVVSTDNQHGDPGTRLQPFEVIVKDLNGDPPTNVVSVTFKVVLGNGKFGGQNEFTDKTDMMGKAEAPFTLGSDIGIYKVEATVDNFPSLTQTFTAAATGVYESQKPTTLAKVSGDDQIGEAGTPLSQPFVIGVLDKNEKPIQDISVTFRVIAGGGRLTGGESQTIDTDEYGQARTTLTLGSVDVNRVEASVADLPNQTFKATATPREEPQPPEPTKLAIVEGNAQMGQPETDLLSPFVVEVRDQYDKLYPGATVNFRVSAGGGSLSRTTAQTDMNGRASATLTLGAKTGGNQVVASVETIPLTQTFMAEANNADVNGDGVVSIIDLSIVAAFMGEPDRSIAGVDANVNGDGRVDIKDLVLVSSKLEWAAAAPSVHTLVKSSISAADIRALLRQAKALPEVLQADPVYQRGIVGLERFLATLTEVPAVPKQTALLMNYPNPFNPETWIPYQLSEASEVTVSIYAVDGRLIRRLALGHQSAGLYQRKSRAAYWDGRNAFGEPVASGLYFYTLTAGDFTATRKMLIRK